MEETTRRIIEIEVDTNDAIRVFRELGEQVAQNKKRLDELKKSGQDNSDEYIRLTNENKVLTDQMRRTEKQIQNNIRQEKSQEKSLVQLRAELANLNKRYDEMSGAERFGKTGTELQQKIAALSNEISGLEANTGRYQRNVGNYKSALEGLSGSFKSVGLSTAGLNKSLNLLSANPIMLFITGLIGALSKLKDAFKGSEKATMEMEETMAAFNPISDKVRQSLDKVVNWFNTKWRESMDQSTEDLVKFLGLLDQLGSMFGEDWGLARQYEEDAKAARDLQKSENDYIKHKREWVSRSAKIDNEVSELRAKAAEKDKYTAEERLAYLDKAIEKETYKAEIEKKLAKENLANLEAEAKRSENSAEMNDKLAAAEAAVYQAKTNLNNISRTLQRQRQAAINEIEGEKKKIDGLTGSVKKNTEAIRDNTEELERQAEEYRKMTLSEMQKAEDALNSIIEDAFEKRQAIEDTAYRRRKDKILEAMVAEEEAHGMETELYQAYMTQWEALEIQHNQNLLAIENDRIAKEQAVKDAAAKEDAERIKKEIELEYQKYENIASITGSIGDILESAAEDNEALVAASKIAALAEVAIQQGVAISKAVAAAADVPYPGNILAIASSVASALAAIVPALKSINSAKLARGTSYVQGPGTGTSDSVPAMLSRGEGVVTAKANSMFPGVVGAMNDASVGIWSPLMSMLKNSGGAPAQVPSQAMMYSTLGENFLRAVAGMNLVVSVEEINRVQGSVKVVENLGSV